MPEVRGEVKVCLEFEMWCATCGAGICHNVEYIKGTDNEFNVHCDNCVKEAEDLERERDELLELCQSLREENDELQMEIDNAAD